VSCPCRSKSSFHGRVIMFSDKWMEIHLVHRPRLAPISKTAKEKRLKPPEFERDPWEPAGRSETPN
jgi:hypothetical protein